MEHSQSIIFVQFFCLIGTSCTIAWAIYAGVFKIAPNASWRFALANICTVSGVLLYTQRTDSISYLYWFIADMAVLLGFALVRWGCQHLFKQTTSYLFDLVLLASCALLMLLVPPSLDYAVYLVIVMSITAAILISLTGLDNAKASKKHMSMSNAILINVPFLIMGALFVIRAMALFYSPEDLANLSAADKLNSPMVMWSYIILLLLTNLVLYGNALTRLVFKVSRLVNKDHLTGLWNRHALLDKLDEVDALWQRNGSAYSLLVLDVDHFKQVNDTYGHMAGDAVLKHTAMLMQHSLRKIDFICRYGGEEFLIILPSTNHEEAMFVAKKIQSQINNTSVKWKHHEIAITLSIGTATCKNHISVEQLLQLADEAMYLAKNAGRNTICTKEPENLEFNSSKH
ncbi:GGDEF domain-containing protein [Shewanella inventionis]|uniref:diguanylate cyclase n=1 Tax=Shewanella inventionis TaxID=1738770 RepID=A0ABQ1JNG4_9GAMM|nr:GGDEF domain-containing protein [Shewanella inventionis]MCL1159138.1 GGDEF domain-containing protein [Shewanella inventionis]UAL43798.1 GGDEF domain-containing protein [Shewanella inventionis]GGB71498.1 GGDEF domain-containing protein [Shewanella inventionis]